MSEREALLRRFHAERPGITSEVFAGRGSYARLAAAVAGGDRVLDLGCGDDHLIALCGPRAVGIDLAPARRVGQRALVTGRAQALPFADRAFDACVSHLAFMLFDELDAVVRELRRVTVPGGRFAAVLGGGPTADGGAGERDAFHAFLDVAALTRPRLGDRRASHEAGWRALFGGAPRFERFVIDLSGPFDQVWRFLGASYQLTDAAAARAALAGQFAGRAVVPCRVVMWLATVEL